MIKRLSGGRGLHCHKRRASNDMIYNKASGRGDDKSAAGRKRTGISVARRNNDMIRDKMAGRKRVA